MRSVLLYCTVTNVRAGFILYIYETSICYNISVSQRATARKERQTVYEYKKILSRPTPVYPHNFWGRSPRRNERPYKREHAGRDERPFAM